MNGHDGIRVTTASGDRSRSKPMIDGILSSIAAHPGGARCDGGLRRSNSHNGSDWPAQPGIARAPRGVERMFALLGR